MDDIVRRCVLVFQTMRLIQQFVHYAVDAEATFTSTERIRYYIKVSVHCAMRYVDLDFIL